MAQIVLIDKGTLREGINEVGDVVSIHDDNVYLDPRSYGGFKVVNAPGTKEEVEARLASSLPQTKRVFRSSTPAGEWGDTPPEEAEVWNDNGTWRKVEKRPKYQINLPVTEELTNALSDRVLEAPSKLSLLGSAAQSNLAAHADNQAELKIATTTAEAETA
jgi:hypothetical protein